VKRQSQTDPNVWVALGTPQLDLNIVGNKDEQKDPARIGVKE
jgi:hypothetical protein